jgi:arylsulfatase
MTQKTKITVFLLAILANVHVTAADERPNILLIVADDLGYTDLGAWGSEIPTPSLDALAYEGVRFTNFHTDRVCQQTRTMLMSGRGYGSAIKLQPPRPDGERDNEMRLDVATVPELLREAGYRTYMAGKWDLGVRSHVTPQARGFDRSFALLEASASHFAEYFWVDNSYYREDDRPLELDDLPADFYSSIGFTDKFLEYLRDDDGDAPWFGYLAYTAPHWPLQVPEDWLDRHAGNYDQGYDELRAKRAASAMERGVIPPGATIDRFVPIAEPWTTVDPELKRRYIRAQEIYASMVELLDQQVGRLVEHLRETGELDNTVIVFLSDNGASAAEIGIKAEISGVPPHFKPHVAKRDNSFDNFGRVNSFIDHGRGFGEAATAPLKYFKSSLAEGGIRTPAFVHYPAAVPGRKISNTFITVMDILPTLLDIAGTEHPGAAEFNGRKVQAIAGRSFWPHLAGDAPTVHGDDHAAGWSQGATGALIRGRYKLTNHLPPGVPPAQAELSWRLYDLDADPGETTDLASRHPGLVSSMITEWEQDWR